MARKIKPTIDRFRMKNSIKIYEIGKVPILIEKVDKISTGKAVLTVLVTFPSLFCIYTNVYNDLFIF
jgi:hypothetical protein